MQSSRCHPLADVRERWWELGYPVSGKGAADRHYWRVECEPFGLQCELYHDTAQNVWVLG